MKLSHHGRRSGGITLLVHKNLKQCVQKVGVQYENFVDVKVSKQLAGGDRDMLYVSVYCQPSGSP